MSKTSLTANSVPAATNSGTNATASTVPRRSLFAASTAGSKPFLNDTISTRGAKDDNPFIEPPVRKLFKPQSVSSSTGRHGPEGGPATSMFGRSRLLQKSVTGKSLSATSTSAPGTSSTSVENDGQKTGARNNNKQRLVLTRVYPINSTVRFSGASSSNSISSDPVTSTAVVTPHPTFDFGITSVPTPARNISSEETDVNDHLFSQSSLFPHPSTTPKAPPPNREFYQSLSKVAAPRFPKKTHDDPQEKDTSKETDDTLSEQSHTLVQDPPQRQMLPPSNVMAFARKSIMKHATSSPHSIFRKFDKNKPNTDTTNSPEGPSVELVHSSPQETSLDTEAPSEHNTRMEIDDQPATIVQPQVPRTIKPSDGFFVFQSQSRPDIPAKPATAETKAKPARLRPIERPAFSRSVLDFSKQPDPEKDISNSTPISTQDRSKLVNTSSELILNPTPTLYPIPPREPQLMGTSTRSLDTDSPDSTDSRTFDLRAALRTVSDVATGLCRRFVWLRERQFFSERRMLTPSNFLHISLLCRILHVSSIISQVSQRP